MFRVHTPIIRSIRCWVAAYGFLHRVFWMGGGPKSRCVGRVYGADSGQEATIRTVHTTHAAALKTTTHPKTRCRKPYAATQHLMLLMMGLCTWNMSSQEYINKTTLLHQVGISNYFIQKSLFRTQISHLHSTLQNHASLTLILIILILVFHATASKKIISHYKKQSTT